jgi:hypothetical protein
MVVGSWGHWDGKAYPKEHLKGRKSPNYEKAERHSAGRRWEDKARHT